MASSSALLLLLLLAFLAVASAKGPNITEILLRGSQYNNFIRFLSSTGTDTQITNQLNNSNDGLTVFAPTDNAFNNLKQGELNSLTTQQQVAFVQYHVIPKFYTLEDFQTASNPLRTQASGNGGDFFLNVSSSVQQTNVSTGVVNVPIANKLNVTKPLAVYSIDQVLLPSDLFGPKKNVTKASAPASEPPAEGSPVDGPSAASGKNGTSTAQERSTGGRIGTGGGWRRVLFAMGLIGALILV